MVGQCGYGTKSQQIAMHVCRFTYLKVACAKDPFALPNINRLIDGSTGYRTLSSMDAYSRYNQIRMDPLDAPKTTFISNQSNYHMPFGLENAWTTYQRLMEAIFAHQIRQNLEVYVDDMLVKTVEGHNHTEDPEDVLRSFRKCDIRLNPTKCSFGVQSGKFPWFTPTHRGIEANPNMCQATMRSLTNAGNKAFLFFVALKKKESFEWTTECEEFFPR